MSDTTMTAAERRTALKKALRAIPSIRDIADKAVGKREVSTLTMAELETVAAAANLDMSSLAAPAVPKVAGATDTPDSEQPDNVVALRPDVPVSTEHAPADDVVDSEVAAVLATGYAGLPAAVRALVVRANTPRVVEVERVVERVVEVQADTPPALPGEAWKAAHGEQPKARAAAKTPKVRLLRTAPASEVFEVSHPVLDKLQVAIYNDPDAPAIDPGYAFDADTLALTLWRMAAGASVLLSGPKGTGKTTFAEQIAAHLGRYFALLSFDRTTEIDPLIGQIELAEGATFWCDGALVAAMRRPGSIILFDEPDCAKAGSLAALHPVLANKSILIPRTGERVDCAEGVYFLAAANTTGHGDETGTYVDRNLLDAAFLDRFADIILVPYPDERTERRILVNRTGINRGAAKILVEFARTTRARADKEQDIAAGLGMRRLIAWASGLLSGLRPETIFRNAVINQHNREEGEVLWQLYKQAIKESELIASIEQVEPAETEDKPDADII